MRSLVYDSFKKKVTDLKLNFLPDQSKGLMA